MDSTTTVISKRIKEGVRSDWLPELRRIASLIPELAPFIEEFLRIHLVIDANYVQQEIQARLKHRKPEARTRLHESVDSGVLVLFAPTFLLQEIEDHLQDIALRVGCGIADVRREWETIRPSIHLYQPRSKTPRKRTRIVDPDDLAYVVACEELGAHAVYSRDKHLRLMEAPVIKVAIDASLQSYARSGSVQLAFLVGSAFSVRIGMVGLKAVAASLVSLYKGFTKLRPALQIAIVASLIYVFVNPKLRAAVVSFVKRAGRAASPIVEALAIAAEQFQISEITLESSKGEIAALMPVRGHIPVLARARRICLVRKEPVTLGDLEERIRREGHQTTSTNFRKYLRQVLKSSGEFVETATGWQLASEQHSP